MLAEYHRACKFFQIEDDCFLFGAIMRSGEDIVRLDLTNSISSDCPPPRLTIV